MGWLPLFLSPSPPQQHHLSLQCCRRTLRKQLDHNLTFHKLVAYALALLTGITLCWAGTWWGLGGSQVGDCFSPAQLYTPLPTSSTWSDTTTASKPPMVACLLSYPRCTCKTASG